MVVVGDGGESWWWVDKDLSTSKSLRK